MAASGAQSVADTAPWSPTARFLPAELERPGFPSPQARIASWSWERGKVLQQGKGWETALFSRQEGMAVIRCNFVVLFPFHEVLKAPGTVLIAHVVEHKQQTFERVWEPNLSQRPLPLWCQLSVTRSDPSFSRMMSEVPAPGYYPWWSTVVPQGQTSFQTEGNSSVGHIGYTQSESVLRFLERPSWVSAVSDPSLTPLFPLCHRTEVPQRKDHHGREIWKIILLSSKSLASRSSNVPSKFITRQGMNILSIWPRMENPARLSFT